MGAHRDADQREPGEGCDLRGRYAMTRGVADDRDRPASRTVGQQIEVAGDVVLGRQQRRGDVEASDLRQLRWRQRPTHRLEL
jgi:hypothetical protein